MRNAPRRFDLRKSPVDGRFRKWEQKWASSLGLIDQEEAEEMRSDYLVWVVTGSYKSRREVFAK